MQLPGVYAPRRFGDNRGWFSESYNARLFENFGIADRFVQDNHSYSAQAGTLRGIHFQAPPFDQAKLVRCLRGRIWDMAVDLRAGSPSYGTWRGVELSAENGHQLYVPTGFGHAFLTLTPDCEISYKVSGYYAPEHEGGIIWNDPALAVEWPFAGTPTLSQKDADLPRLADFDSPFPYDGTPFDDIRLLEAPA